MRRGWREKEFGKDFVDIQISPHFYQQIKPDEPNEWTPGKERKLQREEAFFSNASSLKQLTDSKQSGEEDEDTPSIKGNEKEKSSNALIKMRSGNVVLDDRVRYPDSLSQVRHVDWSILDPKGLKLSRSFSIIVFENLLEIRLASHQWSRIIRQPRKRKGHIILDVCASCSEQKGCQGKLQRHVDIYFGKQNDLCFVDYRSIGSENEHRRFWIHHGEEIWLGRPLADVLQFPIQNQRYVAFLSVETVRHETV